MSQNLVVEEFWSIEPRLTYLLVPKTGRVKGRFFRQGLNPDIKPPNIYFFAFFDFGLAVMRLPLLVPSLI